MALKANLVYKSMDETVDVCNWRNDRVRKILWFTPMHTLAGANKIRKEFFRLLKKNFPSSSSLYKIFNNM